MWHLFEQVIDNGERQPLGFFSANFDNNKSHWATYDKDLYAIYSAVENYQYLLEGRDVLLVTDHKRLIHIFTTKNPTN